jgi:hypothetical protein
MPQYLLAMGLFALLKFAIFGLIIGILAKLVMPGKDPGGFWITMLLGVAGSLVATWIFAGSRTLPGRPNRRLDRLVLWRHSAADHLQDVSGKDRLIQTPFAHARVRVTPDSRYHRCRAL